MATYQNEAICNDDFSEIERFAGQRFYRAVHDIFFLCGLGAVSGLALDFKVRHSRERGNPETVLWISTFKPY